MSTDNLVVLLVMGAYLAFMLWIGRRTASKVGDLSSYVLAGRDVPWYMLAMTFLATVASPVQLLGQPGFAYTNGFSLYFWEKIVVITVIVLLVVPIGRRLRGIRVSSIADVARARYPGSNRLHYTLTVFQMLWGVFVAALSVFGGSLLISVVTGLPEPVALTIIVGVTLIYTILGGLRAVMLTDTAQWAIIIVGVALFLPLLFVLFGPFSSFFAAELGGSGFAPTGGADALRAGFTDIYSLPEESAYLLTAVAFLITSGAMSAADPTFAQRMLAARTDRDGRLGAYAFALLYLFIAIIILALGMYGRVLMPNLGQSDQVLLLLAQNYLPVFGKALFLTAVAAAAMSTISSYLNVTAGIFVKNIVVDRHPAMSQQRQVLWTRVGTVFGALAALLFAPIASGGLAVMALGAQIILMAAVAPLIMAILFWKRLTERGAFWGFIVTTIVTLALIVVVGGPDAAVLGPGLVGVPVLFWGLGVAVVVFGAVSLIDPRAPSTREPQEFDDYFAGRVERVRPSRRAVIGIAVMWAVLLSPLAWRLLSDAPAMSIPPLAGPTAWLTDVGILIVAAIIVLASIYLVARVIAYARASLSPAAGRPDSAPNHAGSNTSSRRRADE